MSFPAYLVCKEEDGSVVGGIESITLDDLPAGDVLIEVAYSSLNYKDALACQGHPGVVHGFPHVPGIDCAGKVAESSCADFKPDDEVLVTGYDLGAASWGGYSKYVRVPAEWVVPLPDGMTTRQSMIYGTAGFTAAQSVDAIVRHGITPESGDVVVTGATGGVGSLAVAILSKLGYQVAAVTGKPEQHDLINVLGAQQILSRSDVLDESDRPLLKSCWAGAVDTVGGKTLSTLLRSMSHRGCVTACGLVGGDQLPLTVYPFLLRGVTLAGIDSAHCPRGPRLEIWRKLANEWSIDALASLAEEISLYELPNHVQSILGGKVVGRTLVKLVTTGSDA